MAFFTGTPSSIQNISTLASEQKPLYNQLTQAGIGSNAFGESANYYKGLLGQNSQAFDTLAAPELRRFREQTLPGLATQFGGMHGGLSSSAFRDATQGASVDLSERLAALREQLKSQGAQGLLGIGQQGLGQFSENLFRPREPGLLDQIGPILTALAGGAGTALGNTDAIQKVLSFLQRQSKQQS